MRLLLVFCCLILGDISLSGQSFYKEKTTAYSFNASSVNTRSIRGWKTGVSIGGLYNERLATDLYYVRSIEGEPKTRSHYGAEFAYVINPVNRLQFLLNLRLGIYEQQFLAVLPGVAFNWNATERLFLKVGLSRSDGYPFFSFQTGIRFLRSDK